MNFLGKLEFRGIPVILNFNKNLKQLPINLLNGSCTNECICCAYIMFEKVLTASKHRQFVHRQGIDRNQILSKFDLQEFNFGTIPVSFLWISVCPKKSTVVWLDYHPHQNKAFNFPLSNWNLTLILPSPPRPWPDPKEARPDVSW